MKLQVGQALSLTLRRHGVSAVFGEEWPGLGVVPAEGAVAPLLALAHERLTLRTAAIHRQGRLTVGARRALGPPAVAVEADEPGAVLEAAAGAATGVSTASVMLSVDPAAPVELEGVGLPSPTTWSEPPPGVLERLDKATTPLVVAGPGVVVRGAVGDLRALAAAGGLGVLNSFGAKGVVPWRSQHHLATVGLQRQDLELAGLGACDLVLASGLDEAELEVGELEAAAGGEVVEVPPAALGPLCEAGRPARRSPPVAPLRRLLAEVTEAGWRRAGRPAAPTRLTATYADCLGSGLVAADPGEAGFFVARTFPTAAPGQALVPAEADAGGFALACALLAARYRPGWPALAVADAPLGQAATALLEEIERTKVPVVVELWDPAGPALSGDEHRERLVAALAQPAPGRLEVAPEASQRLELEAVAGPRRAWLPREVEVT